MIQTKSTQSLYWEFLNFDPFFRFVEFGAIDNPPLASWYSATYEMI